MFFKSDRLSQLSLVKWVLIECSYCSKPVKYSQCIFLILSGIPQAAGRKLDGVNLAALSELTRTTLFCLMQADGIQERNATVAPSVLLVRDN